MTTETKAVRIDLPDGEWWEIKGFLTFGEVEGLSDDLQAEAQSGKTSIPILVLGSVAWSFRDGEESRPITKENIRALNVKYVTPVLQEMMRQYPLG